MSTVLWGAHHGDVQFGSREDWRRHIPFGAEVVVIVPCGHFDVGDMVALVPGGDVVRVVGMEPPWSLGVEGVS